MLASVVNYVTLIYSEEFPWSRGSVRFSVRTRWAAQGFDGETAFVAPDFFFFGGLRDFEPTAQGYHSSDPP